MVSFTVSNTCDGSPFKAIKVSITIQKRIFMQKSYKTVTGIHSHEWNQEQILNVGIYDFQSSFDRFNVYIPNILNTIEIGDQLAFDNLMHEVFQSDDINRTSFLKDIIIAASIAFIKASAFHAGVPVYEYLLTLTGFDKIQRPSIIFNMIAGGSETDLNPFTDNAEIYKKIKSIFKFVQPYNRNTLNTLPASIGIVTLNLNDCLTVTDFINTAQRIHQCRKALVLTGSLFNTTETFIADLAFAIHAEKIHVGGIERCEYARLVEIESVRLNLDSPMVHSIRNRTSEDFTIAPFLLNKESDQWPIAYVWSGGQTFGFCAPAPPSNSFTYIAPNEWTRKVKQYRTAIGCSMKQIKAAEDIEELYICRERCVDVGLSYYQAMLHYSHLFVVYP
uniref:Inosine/uridine-preferring nucleoside hydrolase domain-containing protein n=1 Tax=Panagrolaimus davidi TaxID=227884 RepID=A0A914PN58_9BILA